MLSFLRSLFSALPAPITFPPERGEVLVLPISVVDGDTIKFCFVLEGDARLLGINAPEVHGEQKAAGMAAAAYLRTLMPDGLMRVTLHGRDKYGRFLAILYDAEGRDINSLMIQANYAVPWDGKGVRP